nr:spry domain protein [uncultured Mediterranean phage uvMED]
MPLILGTNSIKDTGFNVANSLRFNSASSDYLNRTNSVSEVSAHRQTFTFSFWLKRSKLGTNQELFGVDNDGSRGNNYFIIDINTADELDISEYISGSQFRLITNRKFRDVSAWMNIVFAVDTTQATASNRLKLYINGVQETSFSTENYPSQNYTTKMFSQNKYHAFGRSGAYIDGYLAEVVAIAGTQLDPTSFGEFDSDTNIWKPIDVSGLTFGTNGFYLDFENSGSLGADVSGNSNNFTVNNLTSVDQSTDTCTNNFATLNPLNIDPGDTNTFSEGNLKCVMNGEGTTSTIAMTSGKWYMEYKVGSPTTNWTGVQEVNALISDSYTSAYSSSSIYIAGATVYLNGSNNSGSGGYGSAWSSGDIGMIAFDADNERVYFGKGGSWWSGSAFDSATPATYIQLTNTGHDYYFRFVKGGNTSCTYEVNFGSPAFSISSGNSDGNGYGNFEYAVPSGYYALNTKNLAEYG